MRINKGIKSIAKNISANTIERPVLASVLFKGDMAMATDSFKATKIVFDTNIYNQALPQIKGFTHMKTDEQVLIKSCDIISAHIPKTSSKTPFLDNSFVGNIDGKNVSLAYSDLSKESVTTMTKCEGEFPDLEKHFTKKGDNKVGVSVDFLMDVLKVYKDFGIKDIKMSIGESLDPIIIEANSELPRGIRNIESILMPKKLN